MQKVMWTADSKPIVDAQASTVEALLYRLRCLDHHDGLLLDAVSVDEILQDGSGQIYDALVVPLRALPAKMEQLHKLLNLSQRRSGEGVTVAAMQVSPPFTKNGTTNVAAVFELSDGQTITIYFHNPETTPKKMALEDSVVSWKWLLNKMDITIAVAPERGRDLDVRQVAQRVMALAVANSKKFQASNQKRAEKLAEITSLKDKIASVDAELGKVLDEINALEIEHGEDAAWQTSEEAGATAQAGTADATETAVTEPAAQALPILDIASCAAVVAIEQAPMRVPADWVQMNGSTPLQGSETQVIERADLPGRYCAALDPQDELSGEYLSLNTKAGASVVFVATQEQVRTMALNTAPVYQLPALLALTLEEQQIALEPYIRRLNERTYAELLKLAAEPVPTPAPIPEASAAVLPENPAMPAQAETLAPSESENAPIASTENVVETNTPATTATPPMPATPPLEIPPVSKTDAMKALNYLKPFMSAGQRSTVKSLMQGEEKQFFFDKMVELADIVRNMPQTYQQRGDEPTYYLHYFKGGADWYIAEKDKLGDGTLQAFGLADLYNDGGELGYINIGELVAAGVELDFHFDPRKMVSPDTSANNTPSTQTEKQIDTKAVDAQFLRDVINGTIDIWENDPAERLEAMAYTYEKDAEMYPLWSDAVTTYTDYMIAKMQKVLNA